MSNLTFDVDLDTPPALSASSPKMGGKTQSPLLGEMSPLGDREGFMNTQEWLALEDDFKSGKITHCAAITAPLSRHMKIVYRAAELYLGINIKELNNINNMNKNVINNSDLIILGEIDKAPRIDECRMLIDEIALKPVSSPKNRRLAVVLAADKLLRPAANSLLKISEEPPAHACILFMLDAAGRRLLPTLKSRARFIVLRDKNDKNLDFNSKKGYNKALREPASDADWIKFAADFRDLDYLEAADALGELARARLERGSAADISVAARFERLRLIALTRRLSSAMLCDLVLLSMKEGMPFERVFNDI